MAPKYWLQNERGLIISILQYSLGLNYFAAEFLEGEYSISISAYFPT